MRNVLDRRRVLRGILGAGGAVTIPLPVLDIMLNGHGTALAATGEPLPVRYVTWFFGNGVLPATWHPMGTGSGDAWALTPQLAPLAKVKDSLNVVSGLSPYWLPDAGHYNLFAAAISGTYKFVGPSLDQVVADAIGQNTRRRSYELGVSRATSNQAPGSIDPVAPFSRRTNGVFLIPEYDPRASYTQLIGAPAPTNTIDIRALTRTRGSAFDAVMEDTRQLSKQLGTADRMRLDGHLEGLRTLANRVAALPPTTTVTTKPNAPALGPDTRAEAPPELNSVMAELGVFALATGQTNVLSIVFSWAAAHVYFRNLGPDMNADFHNDICHGDPGTAGNQPRVQKGVVYTMQCLAEFLERMKATPEGADSNLLDRSLVHVTSCSGWGKTHAYDDFPVLLAGGAGGRIRTNQHLRFSKGNITSVLLTMANAMGLGLKEFGAGPGLTSMMLPGLLV